MCIVSDKQRFQRAFTLLEIMLAVGILGMMSMVIYRFVAANITVLRISSEENAAEARYAGFIHLVTSQLQDLPNGAGALSGETFVFNDKGRDEISWICGTGPGLATRYAPGEYIVRMRMQPVKEGNNTMEIGLLRKPRDTAEGSTEGVSWVPLLEDVRGIQVRYFDPRVNVWKENWTDPTLPPLVKFAVDWGGRPTREAVIALRRSPLPLILPAQIPGGGQVAPGQVPQGQGSRGQPGQVQPPGQQPPKGGTSGGPGPIKK